jgi:hypothetical protein
VIIMRAWTIRLLTVALVLAVAAPAATATFNVFDRADFVRQVRVTFQPLEARLAPGDQFDYDHAAFFSGFLNGRDEHLVVLLLTETSPSVTKARELGIRWSWEGANPLPLFAIMVLPPTDCVRDVEYSIPYLVRGLSWETGDVIDASGAFVRDVQTSWARGTEPAEPMYLRFSGNLKIHLQTCVTISMNQN